ncbi:MAG: fasciclin domain-containing protein [Planctomycetota bacterium]|nr:MAG: fasciclin domain-containing protein [Planctomycetota bacterium]
MRWFGFAFLLLLAIAVSMIGRARPAVAYEPVDKDIVDVAVEAGSFKTLAAALQAADLVETLKGKGPFTVFAPTDEAFAKLPKGTVEALLKDKAKLTAILTYHVVAGEYPAAKVVEAKHLKSVQGSPIDVKVTDAGVTVSGAKVIKTDIRTSNGIIHVIDSVILPPKKHEKHEGHRHAGSTSSSACPVSGK